MTNRSVSPAPALVVNTASPAPIDHIRIVSASPGNTGEAKRPSMWWKRVGSLPHTEALPSRCYGIPWFKHDWPESIEQYAAAFKKVALQAERLLTKVPK